MRINLHKIFRTSIFVKGIYSLIELAAGFMLLFISSNAILSMVRSVFRHELLEDPHDLFANYIINFFGSFSFSLKIFIAWYLIIHGAIKLGLISALWLKKIKAYPISIGVFILFLIYQIYKYILTPSLILIILSVLDVLIIILTYIEYKHIKRYGAHGIEDDILD